MMREIRLSKVYDLPADIGGRFAEDSDYDQVIAESARVLKPDGSFLCALVRGGVPVDVMVKAWPAIKDWMPLTDNRGQSSGVKSRPHVRTDGTVSKSRRVPRYNKIVSGVVGYYDRYPRFPFCRPCAWNADNPAQWAQLVPVVQAVARVHEQACPDFYAKQKALYDRTNADFKIPGSVYTTVTVNKNYRTAYHLDGKNLEGVVSAMLLIRDGKIKGGLVVFPQYRAAVQMDSGDVLMFDGQAEWHGNTAIVPLTGGAQRCTLVHYFRQGMVYCGSAADELERAKRRTPGQTLQRDNLNPLMDG